MVSITSFFANVMTALNSFRSSPQDIPTLMLLSGAKMRVGLSPKLIAAKIIARQTEAGAPAGVLPSGSDNVSEKMEIIRVEEIINAILLDARVDIAVEQGIPVIAQGGNAGGPIIVQGQTIMPGNGFGIIR